MMTILISEIEKDDKAGVTVELKRERQGATDLEVMHQDAISHAIKIMLESISEQAKMSLIHFDKETSQQLHDQFFNSLGVETIEQRRERLKE
jgi:ssRNA-specific RNase YbeY (16S rRNA maturation enzyme)